uniref:Uncharacterized protein n=1 Tax=Rhizophora mucronata TaxID=61149 RepID=A0A2P2IWM8_RHIMU
MEGTTGQIKYVQAMNICRKWCEVFLVDSRFCNFSLFPC